MQLFIILLRLLNFGFQLINLLSLEISPIIFIISPFLFGNLIIFKFLLAYFLNSFMASLTEIPFPYPQFKIVEILFLSIFCNTL